jgi:guanylate cyclase
MLSIGLFLHDLNFYDGSSEILISGMQHARTLQDAIDKQHAWIMKLQGSKLELQEWRRKGKRLLYSLMPRHIAQMLQQGVLANSICEVIKKNKIKFEEILLFFYFILVSSFNNCSIWIFN